MYKTNEIEKINERLSIIENALGINNKMELESDNFYELLDNLRKITPVESEKWFAQLEKIYSNLRDKAFKNR